MTTAANQQKKPLAYFFGENPLRAIEWPIWSMLLFAGVYLLSPAFVPAGGSNGALAETVGSPLAFKIYAAIVFVVGLTGLLGLIFHKPRLRKFAGYVIFFTFLYFTILRVVITGPLNLGWITYAVNTLLSAAIILRLKWEEINGTVD